MAEADYDVAIVGASIAGCTAATLFARQGARVALIERETEPGAYKKVCTHYIQGSATPTIERLGLASPIEAAGGIRNGAEFWTRWGWIRQSEAERRYGYNIRREKLDPMLRELAANTPSVEFMPGHSAHQLMTEAGRICGVQTKSLSSAERGIVARLVVAADGRNSRIAELAGIPTKAKPHRRFAYFAHFRELPLSTGNRSQMWFLEPDVAYAFPNDDGITLLAAMPAREKLESWKADTDGSMRQLFERLLGAPSLATAVRISPYIGMLEMPNLTRRASRPGLALIGDAALAADPLWGVGCGWAFQSAAWLVDSVAGSLGDAAALDQALERYRKRHRWELSGHDFLISDYATGRAFNPIEKLMFSAAARDAASADHLIAFGGRHIGVAGFLAPTAIARAARVNLAHYFLGMRTPATAQ
jgi:flavin-dependent dehydrogenase